MVTAQERPAPLAIAKITNLEDKFLYDTAGMYDAEIRFLEALQLTLPHIQNNQLKSLFETHIRETQQQIKNLEQVFSAIGQQPTRVNCDVAAGAVSDGQKEMLLSAETPSLLELTIAGEQAKVEHLEVISYRCLIQVAEQMGQNQVVELLRQNLQQEEQTVQKLEQCSPQLLQEALSTSRSARR
ncbi:YciE/YciF family protein [Nostocales cyanobacterium HT-58-2]|nr:YciE/YciF family protein [Nostocales cyanobacterium HT-58-2]